VHHELDLFVKECGFSPAEALRAATFSDRGEIKAGLRADLMLVEGNPVENIDDTLNLRGVWTEGVLCKTYEGLL
jgi:imidazolonepropionase-like amidohydrolase